MDTKKQKEWRKLWQENNIETLLFHTAKSRAKKFGIDFTIEKSDIIVPTHCPLLGVKLDHTRGIGRRDNGASIDRIDSTKGYIKGNIQIISDLANKMKSNATKEQLITFANNIINLYKENK